MPKQITVRSYIKGVDQAPRKVAIVASLVRNRTVSDAVVILDNVPRRSALPVKKAIESARANAINNNNLDSKSLTISTISVTAGKRLKRYKPASRGRALPFEKKTANILVKVTGIEKAAKKASSTKVTKVEESK
jgi:large subunit ribosomal protein L22